MRPLLATLVSSAALLGAALPAAAVADGNTGPQEIAFLNAQRAANGIPSDVVEVPAFTDGCRLHMAYLAGNNLFQHDEWNPGDPKAPALPHPELYTPEGDAAGNASVLIKPGSAFTATGTNRFETAPIHLSQMLSPWMTQSGSADGCLATLRGPQRVFSSPTSFTYPGDGGTAPISERAAESPFVPGDFVGLPQGTTTGPLLYFFNAGTAGNPPFGGSTDGSFAKYYSDGAITSASLTGPDGPVAMKTVDNTTTSPSLGALGPYLPPGGIIIPVAPLKLNAAYTASVTFQATQGGAGPVQKTWSFTTGVVAPKPDPTPTPSPVPTPAPVPAATPVPTPAISGTLPAPVLRSFTLLAGSTTISTSTDATVWVSIQQQVRRAHGKGKAWKVRRAYAVRTKAGASTKTRHRRLPKGSYRVQLRLGSAKGALLTQTVVKVR